MTVHAHAAFQAKEELKPFSYEIGELGPFEVEIRITHCGICHSDIHLIDNDWGMSQYPLVPGHEVVGHVTRVGREVGLLREGDRVGVGWQSGSCFSCEWCTRGEEHLCDSSRATCVGNYGGFGEYLKTDARYTFKVPDALPSETAAPLMCGGITTYSPIREWVKPWMKVGVVGIGGLGHLALQYANAFGCEVTAFSSAWDKQEEAKGFGAHHYACHRDGGLMHHLKGKFDFILSTVNAPLDWPAFLSLLRPKGTLAIVGVAPGELHLPVFPLIVDEKRVVGSVIGSRTRIIEMLDFSARHNIQAKSEVVAMSEVNAAVDRVRKSEARYRMVLKN